MTELEPTPALPAITHAATPRWPPAHLLTLLALWLAIFFASLWSPPLLNDADATHAQAAQSMARTGDWVTLRVDGVRYLEKAPLPYWLAAISLRVFGDNAFAIHLPLALAVLGLALLGYAWSRRTFGERTALYTAVFTLTTTGVFLFTRIFIPEVLLSLFLCCGLYSLCACLETPGDPSSPRSLRLRWASPYLFWAAMALAVLTKGLVAIVFLLGTAIAFLVLTRDKTGWRKLRPFTGLLLFLAIAAPWHILAGLRNDGSTTGHGFFWFYFVNEHFLRFLGRRIPRDYNKLPALLYWSLHLVWLFPWSVFAPLAGLLAWRQRRKFFIPQTEAQRTVLLLSLFTAIILIFFSLSTNQEYYTFPIYLPLLMLLAAALVRAERDRTQHAALTFAHASFVAIGFLIAAALGYGLWASRHLPYLADIGDVLAHRGIGQYTLSMSHFFDLTGPSFAALRLPAAFACAAFAVGPPLAWVLRIRRKHMASTLTIAATSAAFLIAAHIALVRFTPMLSSENFARSILTAERNHAIEDDAEILIYGDQAFGSSLPFYLDRQVALVDGRSTSMLFGSTYADAPPIFLTSADLLAQWGSGPRKILFVPAERRTDVDRLLSTHQIILQESSGNALLTDRPLDRDPYPHP